MPPCQNCGAQADSTDQFCRQCGANFRQDQVTTGDSEQTQAEPLDYDGGSIEQWLPEDVIRLCTDLIAECEDIEAEFRNRVISIRKAVEGEIKWGGLIFNPEDIGKKLKQLAELYNAIIERGEPMGMTTKLVKVSMWLVHHPPAQTPAYDEVDHAAAEARESSTSLGNQITSTSEWIDSFYVALCNTGAARPLLPLLPPFAWEEEQPTKAKPTPSRGLLSWLFGSKN